MLWLERGNILKRWLSLTCHVISMAQMEVRKMLVTVFHKKNKDIRESFRPVVQNLCSKYLSGQVHMYAELPFCLPCDEEEPALGELVQI